MSESSLQITFGLRDSAEDTYWLRMELVEEETPTQMTIGEAADAINALYDIDICDTVSEPVEREEIPEPTGEDWDRALATFGNLPSCETLRMLEETGDAGSYEVDIKVWRSHPDTEIYKLLISNGTAGAAIRKSVRIEESLIIEDRTSITLDKPLTGAPHIAWTDIDGPDIHILGNTLYWSGSVTGTIRAEYNSTYDLIHIRVTGTQTGQEIVEGTVDAQWLGAGWYPGSEEGTELDVIQDILCSVLAFYHYQYEELILNKPEEDESVDDALANAICRHDGTTTVVPYDPFDPDVWDIAACQEACESVYDTGPELTECFEQCSKICYKRVRYDTICECGGEESTEVVVESLPCPPGYNTGSIVNDWDYEEGGTKYVNCGIDEVHEPVYYEQKCCYPWPWPTEEHPLPECEEHYGPFTAIRQTDEQEAAVKSEYGDDANIIVVGPLAGRCGDTVTTQEIPSTDCCADVPPILWDYDNSAHIISPNGSGTVVLIGGADIIEWQVRADGLWLDAAHLIRDGVGGNTIKLYADSTFCGSAAIYATDGCSSVSEYIRSTVGVWGWLEDVSGIHPAICANGLDWPISPFYGNGYTVQGTYMYILSADITTHGASSGASCSTFPPSDICAYFFDCDTPTDSPPCIDKVWVGSATGVYFSDWNGTNIFDTNGVICSDGYPQAPVEIMQSTSTTKIYGWKCV